MKTKEQAQEAAIKLLNKMKSGGWKIYVHENIGWHYSLYRGTLSLYEYFYNGKPYYTCLLSDKLEKHPGYMGGAGCWTEQGGPAIRDPNKAVERQLSVAKEVVRQFVKRSERAIKLAEG